MEHLLPIADDGLHNRTVTFVDLLARAQVGDQSAAGSLIAENRLWLQRKASRLLSRRAKQHADLSDLAQKCLTATTEHLLQYRGNSIQATGAWLETIVVNKVRYFLRRNRRRLDRQIPFPEDSDGQLVLAARGTSDLAQLQRLEEIAQLPAALEELEADDRDVIVAHFLQNMAYSQLADRFGISEEALRQKGRRAVAKLERAQRLLAAMHRRHLPPHYRRMLCAVRLRNWPTARIATEFGLTEQAVNRFRESAETWMKSPGDNR